jgi:chromosome segregation ATPase
MLKKMVVLTAVGFVAVAALGGVRKLSERVDKAQAWLETRFQGQKEDGPGKGVTPKDIENIRKELKGFDKDILVAAERLATEDREIEDLEKKVAEFETRQSATRAELDARAAAIKGATDKVKIGHRTVRVAEAKAELEADVQACVRDQESVDALKAALGERRSKRDILARQLKALQQQKDALTVRLHKLEVDVALRDLERTQGNSPVGNTRGAKVAKDLEAAEKKVDIERRTQKLVGPAGAATVPAKSDKNVDDIMAPLNTKPAKADAPKAAPATEKAD